MRNRIGFLPRWLLWWKSILILRTKINLANFHRKAKSLRHTRVIFIVSKLQTRAMNWMRHYEWRWYITLVDHMSVLMPRYSALESFLFCLKGNQVSDFPSAINQTPPIITAVKTKLRLVCQPSDEPACKVSNARKEKYFTNELVTTKPRFRLKSAPDKLTGVVGGECYPPW